MSNPSSENEKRVWHWRGYLWRRYAARMIDGVIFGDSALFLILVLIGLAGGDAVVRWTTDSQRWKSVLIFGPLMWVLNAPISAWLIAWRGTTFGKFLFGLRVAKADGSRLSFRQALKREGVILIWGVGVGIPLVGLIMLLRSYGEVMRDYVTLWDRPDGFVVGAARATGWRWLSIACGAVLLAVIMLWSAVERIKPIL